MGIFGVLSFALKERSREIAIRKVSGAREGNIVMFFIREFALIFLIPHLAACPIAHISMEGRLQNFGYRIRQGMQ